ncbi:MAG: hypothetical protein AB7O67_09990 [Vicinamibacterales bacterium]
MSVRPPNPGRHPALWLAGLIVFIGIGGLFVLFQAPRESPAGPSPEAAAGERQGPGRLAARLTIRRGGDDGPHALVLRLYDALARQRATIARGGAGRAWAGTLDDAAGAPASIAGPSIDAWQAALTLEVVNADGTASAVGGGALTLVRVPDGPTLDLAGGESLTLLMELAPRALPPAGTALRVRVTLPEVEALTAPVEVPEAPGEGLASAAASARAAETLGRWDLVRTQADALITAAPDDEAGYYYRGVALEALGDTAGARAAYLQALERVGEATEPPVAITARLARLQ